MNNPPISKRLKEARLAAKLSQKNLGIAAGIDESSASARMSQYETGKYIPDYLTLTRIAQILKVPVAYFYAESDELADWIGLHTSLNKRLHQEIMKMVDDNVFKYPLFYNSIPYKIVCIIFTVN